MMDTAEERIGAAGQQQQQMAWDAAAHSGDASAMALVALCEIVRDVGIEMTRPLEEVVEVLAETTVLQPTGEVILNAEGHVEVPLEELVDAKTHVVQLVTQFGTQAVQAALTETLAEQKEHYCYDGTIKDGPREGCCEEKWADG